MSQQNTCKPNSKSHEKIIYCDQINFISEIDYIYKSINVIEHMNELRDWNNTIILIDSEKALEQNPETLHDKSHGKVGIEGPSTWYAANP